MQAQNRFVATGNITTSSDVYALGVLLYELISGRSPYAGPTHELPLRILSDEPIPLSEGPRDLGPIVRMALQKAPADRYDSVAHLRDDVELLLAGLPVRARAYTATDSGDEVHPATSYSVCPRKCVSSTTGGGRYLGHIPRPGRRKQVQKNFASAR